MIIKFEAVDPAKSAAGKLAECELHFSEGEPMAGLKLVGFTIWLRKSGQGYNVTVPARQYTMNGERRSYALLRPQSASEPDDHLRGLIIAAYESFAAEQAADGS